LRIVLVGSEVAPFSKTGGLGDVVGALGPALARRGHRVMTVSPRYPTVKEAQDTGLVVGVHTAGWVHPVRFFRRREQGVDHVFADHAMFQRSGVYGDANGTYGDNSTRFSVLSRAALEAARRVLLDDGEPLGEDVIFHVHDWPTALVPVLLEGLYRPLGLFPRAPTVLTVHNLMHQGRFPGEVFRDLDLPPRWFGIEGLEWYGDVGFLKGGLMTADQLTTVSPTYAREITSPEQGFGLDGVLRHRVAELTGILNGIDPLVWDPAADPHLPTHFTASDLAGKAECKAALQKEMGLPVNPAAPLVGTVGRLDPQKGVELLLEAIPALVREFDAQFVVLGSAAAAHAHYEQRLKELAAAFPRNVVAWIGFSEPVAHRIEAGSDLFAMPSLFEPCGLNQMYSMRYGTVPVVRSTGGLADSVEPVDLLRDAGTGFVFGWFDARPFTETLRHALWVWRDRRDAFDRIRVRGMTKDWSWDARMPAYEAVYKRAADKRGLPWDGAVEPEPAAPAPAAKKRGNGKKRVKGFDASA
jgi:starch synthase